MPPTNYTVATTNQMLGKSGVNKCEMVDSDYESAHDGDKTTQSPDTLTSTKSPKLIERYETTDDVESRATKGIHGLSTLETPLYVDQQRRNMMNPGLGISTHNVGWPDNRRNDNDSRVAEIYFSPVDLNCSKIELSSPLPTPRVTPTQESYNAGQTNLLAATVTPPTTEKLRLAQHQMDRLVSALMNAPMFQTHVRKQCCDDDQLSRSSQPSLLSPRSALKDLRPQDSAISLTKSPVVTGQSPGLDRQPTTEHTAPVATPKKALQVKLVGMALLNSRLKRTPVHFLYRNYSQSTNVLRVGRSCYLNVPYDSYPNYSLRVETTTATSTTQRCRILMQLINQVLDRPTGKKLYFLVTELDVTESFKKAALTELAEQSGLAIDDIGVKSPGESIRQETSSTKVDWCEVADDLQATCNIAEAVEAAIDRFALLRTETCTAQSLALLSELETIKLKHEDFLIVRSHDEHENGIPSRISVPYISQHLDDLGLSDQTISSEATRDFSTLR